MPPEKPRIFLSYRRDDAKNAVEDLYNILVKEYGQAAVFRDTKSETPGDVFPSVLRDEIDKATVVLVVIGAHWSRRGKMEKPIGQLKRSSRRWHKGRKSSLW